MDRTFDLVIGNHLIEHIPNLLEWLIDMRCVLEASGKIFLSVPDRRYTFDYLRRETTFIDVLRAYCEGVQKPSIWNILETRYYERPTITGAEGWHPEIMTERVNEKRFTWSEAIDLAKEEADRPYTDIHCSVFTKDSFEALFSDMEEAGMAPFLIESIEETRRGTLEFHVVLVPNKAFELSKALDTARACGLRP